MNVITSVVDPNTLNWIRLQDFGPIWNRIQDFGPIWTRIQDFGPIWTRIRVTLSILKEKNLNNFRERLPLKGIFKKKNKMSPQEIFTQLRKSLNYEFIS